MAVILMELEKKYGREEDHSTFRPLTENAAHLKNNKKISSKIFWTSLCSRNKQS